MSRLEPFEGSGVRAAIAYLDDGTELKAIGFAIGLDPALDAATLIYDRQSEYTGPEACQPQLPVGDPDDLRNTECVGAWVVAPDGTATLEAANVFDEVGGGRIHVPLDKIGTTSVRQTDGDACLRPRPRLACGRVK
ncbi:hypothetical protein [Candidatus Entotheonella palauensis]|nr:hypothetical protein [Candidatus Entotheonella palauensis]